MMSTRVQRELESIEVDLLTEGVRRHYGLNLESFARPMLLRRLRQVVAHEGHGSITGLLASVLHSPAKLEALLASLSSDPSCLFEDPPFFAAFRQVVVPWLKTHPSIRLWHVGCGSPEEIYSLAVVLQEEGLLGRTRIYATDGCSELISRAQSGRLALLDEQAAARYAASGGRQALGNYFTLRDGQLSVSSALQERIFYTQHHVTNDGPFNEFHTVVCRNTMLYFNRSQQTRIHGLLFESLARFGFLGIGRKESLRRTPYARAYDEIEGAGRLFRRVS